MENTFNDQWFGLRDLMEIDVHDLNSNFLFTLKLLNRARLYEEKNQHILLLEHQLINFAYLEILNGANQIIKQENMHSFYALPRDLDLILVGRTFAINKETQAPHKLEFIFAPAYLKKNPDLEFNSKGEPSNINLEFILKPESNQGILYDVLIEGESNGEK